MIKELHEKLISKDITALELTQQCLENIESKNQSLNAFLDVFKEEALQQAEQVDRRIEMSGSIGLLEGIPCAIKDNICIEGKRTTGGSKILENYTAPYNATVINKLKDESVVILGKTNMDEFAMGSSTENSAYGVTKNPHDQTRVPGGTSGGSVVAVTADMAVWALGSDTGGSIRQPAAFCGMVGLKPTYGRVSRYGLLAAASSYEQIAPVAKTVEDTAIVLDAISGNDLLDNTTIDKGVTSLGEFLTAELAGKKIGIPQEFFSEGLDETVRKVIESRINYAKENGAEIVQVSLPHIKNSLAVYYLMITSEISSNMARYDGIKYGFSEASLADSKSRDLLDVYLNSREIGLGAEVKRRIILGTYALSAGYYDAYYKKAQKVRELIKRDYQKVFEKVDVLLCPTTPNVAFKIGEKTDNPLEMYLEDIYTVPVNVAGIPAISIPAGTIEKDGKNLPVGLQIMGKWWDEQNVLNVAKGLELSGE